MQTCARLLDQDGIKCGERAGMNIKMFAACLPHEGAYDKFYTELGGTRLHTNCNVDDGKTICFAEHRKLSKDGHWQTTLGVDFTKYKSCVKNGKGECVHRSTWSEYVYDLIKQDLEECPKYLI